MRRSLSSFVTLVRASGRALRDGWLVVGVVILMLVTLEAGFRALRTVKRTLLGPSSASGSAGPPNPFDTSAWANEYGQNLRIEEEVRWAPYVYVRNPTFTSRHVSVDSLGHRITPMPSTAASRPVRVFFFGGSTMFGWYQRDAYTIPAEAGRRLQTLLGSRGRLEVTNFGVPGHTFTQELLELLLQLRAGARPDVVVFYDGINDVMATVQNGIAGLPQNEANRAADFALGRRLAAEGAPGIRNDFRALARPSLQALQRLQFVQRLSRRRDSIPPEVPADSLAHSLADVFAGNARIVEALAAKHDFVPVYVWQPALLSTRKRLTAYEQWLMGTGTYRDVHRAAPERLRASMSGVVGARFIDATALFDHDTLDVFVDFFGHTYERANPRVVDTLMPTLGPAVERAVARPQRQ